MMFALYVCVIVLMKEAIQTVQVKKVTVQTYCPVYITMKICENDGASLDRTKEAKGGKAIQRQVTNSLRSPLRHASFG